MRTLTSCSKPKPVCLLAAVCLAALAAAGGAQAHGDPATHFLEGDVLYPAVANRPSQARELALIGLLRAAEARGYPLKVALVANAYDLAFDTTMVRKPQRYAEFVAGQLDGGHSLRAPLLVVTPYGFGVAGPEERDGRIQPTTRADARALLRGLRVPARAQGDALADAATAAVRRLARAGGHPLPAHVAPAAFVYRGGPGAAAGGRDWSRVRTFAIVFGVLFLLAWLVYERSSLSQWSGDEHRLDASGSRD